MRIAAWILLAALAAGPVAAQIRFECRELPFTVDSGETPEKHLPETTAGGVALFDADGDGDLDLFFANGADMPALRKNPPGQANGLFWNDGRGSFAAADEDAGLAGEGYDIGVAAADYDADGDLDLFVGGVWRQALYRNRGDGMFEDVTEAAGLAVERPAWSVGAIWLDYDGDGWLDLFVVHYVDWDPAAEKRCEVNDVVDYCHPMLYERQSNALYRNRGDGAFEDASEASGIAAHPGKGMAAAAADADGDGDLDVFVTNDRVMNFLFVNEGGRFEERALDAGVALPLDGDAVSGMGTDFRDLDDDGRPDIFFTALANETFPLFLNQGDLYFDDAGYATRLAALTRTAPGWTAAMLDLDFDGRKDLFTTRSDALSPRGGRGEAAKHTNGVFRQLADGTFEDVSESSGLAARPAKMYRGAAFGDVNGDGLIDAVVTALDEPAELCLNRTASPGNALAIRLANARGNREGIGARIAVEVGGRTLHTQVARQYGYASSSEAVVRVGLGSAEAADRVRVVWPSGNEQVVEGPAAGALRIEEPR